MNDLLVSLIRTWTPIAVGGVIAYLATKGVDVDPEIELQAVAVGTSFVSAIYYAVARLLESKWAVFGLLLGNRKEPTYK